MRGYLQLLSNCSGESFAEIFTLNLTGWPGLIEVFINKYLHLMIRFASSFVENNVLLKLLNLEGLGLIRPCRRALFEWGERGDQTIDQNTLQLLFFKTSISNSIYLPLCAVI